MVARVLVTEKIAQSGLDLLADAGHEVDVQEGLSPEQLLGAVAGAVIIRSATQVTTEVLAAGTALAVVGRAGVGLDNVDVDAATERGVMVVNAPTSNILSVAEQAMALLLAQARNIPQAHSALVAGRWERSKWEGVELHGKVLGVVGLGRAGSLVAQRAHAFGMELIGYDPFVSHERARAMGVRLVSIEELVGEADFVSIHTPKTPETIGLFGRDLLAKAKPGIRIVNTARGGIVDEDALAEAIRDGIVAGAGLDVFAKEPCTESPLFDLPQVVVSPHLGASTEEAQDKAGVTIAEQVLLALAGDFVPYAVNVADATSPMWFAVSWAWPSSSAASSSVSTTACPTSSTWSTRASWPGRARASSRCRCSRGSSAAPPTNRCPMSTRRSSPSAAACKCASRRPPPRATTSRSSPCARARTRWPAR